MLALLALSLVLQQPEEHEEHHEPGPTRAYQIGNATATAIGGGHGLLYHEGMLYAFGDGGNGRIVQYDIDPVARTVTPTGRSIDCTRKGDDILPRPTGLALGGEQGDFIGDTYRGVGMIYHVDFDQALEDGTLDHAVRNIVVDDLATGGTRPYYVEWEGRQVIATADSGTDGNQIRLYDPYSLTIATRTSHSGVLLKRYLCGPNVQSLHWDEHRRALVLVQRPDDRTGYMLTWATLGDEADRSTEPALFITEPRDQIRGFVMLDEHIGLTLSEITSDNLRFFRLD